MWNYFLPCHSMHVILYFMSSQSIHVNQHFKPCNSADYNADRHSVITAPHHYKLETAYLGILNAGIRTGMPPITWCYTTSVLNMTSKTSGQAWPTLLVLVYLLLIFSVNTIPHYSFTMLPVTSCMALFNVNMSNILYGTNTLDDFIIYISQMIYVV